MDHTVISTPKIHKRSSSLPLQVRLSTAFSEGDSSAITSVNTSPGNISFRSITDDVPVPPLKFGKHCKSKSYQGTVSRVAVLHDHTSSPQPPAIPERHSGRHAICSWIASVNEKERESYSPNQSSCYSDGVPSLVSISSDSSASYSDCGTLNARYNCIRDLYYSEKQFSEELSIAVKELMQRGMCLGIPEQHLAIVYRNLPHVLEVSCSLVFLLKQLVPRTILSEKHRLEDRDIPSNIGRAMCMWLNSDIYRVYEIYIHRNTAQTKMFRRLSAKHSELHMCIGENSHRELPLRSLLQKPVQRISQYPIYLKMILDLLPSNHADTRETLVAYERVCSYCYSINARIGLVPE